jgi:hypothetical protein
MAGFFDDFKRGFTQARADTAKLSRREPVAAESGASPANGTIHTAEQDSLAEVTGLAEQYEPRIAELETALAGTAVYGEVLQLPGVKVLLRNRFHPDKADVNDSERQWLTEAMQKVNAAYEALEKKGRQEQ